MVFTKLMKVIISQLSVRGVILDNCLVLAPTPQRSIHLSHHQGIDFKVRVHEILPCAILDLGMAQHGAHLC